MYNVLLFASHGYVHLYNSYPGPPVNWTIIFNLWVTSGHYTTDYVLRSHSHVNKLIRYKNVLPYCTPRYSSASRGHVYLCHSHPVPTLKGTFIIEINQSAGHGNYTPVYYFIHWQEKKLIRYKNPPYYCTTCYVSAARGYVQLYNSYLVPPVNRIILFNLSSTTSYFISACDSVHHSYST